MAINKERLNEMCKSFDLDLSETALERLSKYAELLKEWNEKINLTAITEDEEIEVKHFLDSLLLLKAVDIPHSASLIDVGTGAGFPSVPCLCQRDDLNLTLLDSLLKRLNFLDVLCSELGVSAKTEHYRAEDGGHVKGLREKFDFATSRAVANLRDLSEYCLPFVKVGGYFVALKGYDCDEELEEAKPAIKKLGGKVQEIKRFMLPMDNKRAIIIIKKISQTPPQFPRKPHVMAKKPIV